MSTKIADAVKAAPVTSNTTFKAALTPPADGNFDSYVVKFLKNGGLYISQSPPATATEASAVIQVVPDDVVCVQVAAKNAAGISATYQDCLTIEGDPLPPLPGDPDVVLVIV